MFTAAESYHHCMPSAAINGSIYTHGFLKSVRGVLSWSQVYMSLESRLVPMQAAHTPSFYWQV